MAMRPEHPAASAGSAIPSWMISARLTILIACFALVAGNRSEAGPGPRPATTLAELQASRARIARDLTVPIARCVRRHDTKHPVFHGCIDWHSSVHGVWALTAYTRMTGNQEHRRLIDDLLDRDKLKLEARHLARDARFEMPYGRAWFLRLTIEFQRTFKDPRLNDMARQVANSLVSFYSAAPPDPATGSYESASWALINLLEYARHTGNERIERFVEALVLEHFLSAQYPCNLRNEGTGFMAICTNHAWLVSKVIDRRAFPQWLRSFLPAGAMPEPVVAPATPHQNGLNFSRAWGLGALYIQTRDERFLDSYIRHFQQAYGSNQTWNGDYRTVGHWVAQFGMLATFPLFEPVRK